MSDEKSKVVGLRLPPEVADPLVREADQLGVPLATYITGLLKRYTRGDTLVRRGTPWSGG